MPKASMGLITWPCGIEKGPGGRIQLRQIVEPYVWVSSLWISRTGTCWRRHFNTATRQWSWASEPQPTSEELETGRLGLYVNNHWTPLETAIALAWRKRHPESRAPAVRGGKRRRLTAKSISWPKEEDSDSEELDDETWSDLDVRIGVLSTSGLGYKISSHGRLQSPQGLITRGHWFRGRRWSSVRGCGLCDLDTAAGLKTGLPQPPCYQLALNALLTGATAEDLAHEARIKESSAWSYLSKAATFAPCEDLRRVWKALVDRGLVRTLKRMQSSGDTRLGDAISTLLDAVLDALPNGSSFASLDRSDQFRQLWFARTCLTRLGLSDC